MPIVKREKEKYIHVMKQMTAVMKCCHLLTSAGVLLKRGRKLNSTPVCPGALRFYCQFLISVLMAED